MSGWFGSRSTLRPTVGGARARPSGWRWSSNPSISSLAVCKFQSGSHVGPLPGPRGGVDVTWLVGLFGLAMILT